MQPEAASRAAASAGENNHELFARPVMGACLAAGFPAPACRVFDVSRVSREHERCNRGRRGDGIAHGWITVDGDDACAGVACRLSDVIAIYRITPSSGMADAADAWSAAGRPNLWGAVPSVVEMQSGPR